MSAIQIFGTDTSGADRPPTVPNRVSMAKARIAQTRWSSVWRSSWAGQTPRLMRCFLLRQRFNRISLGGH